MTRDNILMKKGELIRNLIDVGEGNKNSSSKETLFI